jgi:hypothetical protein
MRWVMTEPCVTEIEQWYRLQNRQAAVKQVFGKRWVK